MIGNEGEEVCCGEGRNGMGRGMWEVKDYGQCDGVGKVLEDALVRRSWMNHAYSPFSPVI